MHILSVEAVSKDYGLRPILENVSLGLDSDDRVGVVGVNGSGKTTFLRLVAGAETSDAGRITFADGVTVGYLPQNPPYDAEATVLEAVFAASDARMRRLGRSISACASATRFRCPPESVPIRALVSVIPNLPRTVRAFVSSSHAPEASRRCASSDTRSNARRSSPPLAASSPQARS